MKIRSITCFLDPTPATLPGTNTLVFEHMGELAKTAQALFQQAGYEVQSTRLATLPFHQFLLTREASGAVRVAKLLERLAKEQGFAYLSIGPALPEHPASYAMIPAILAETEAVFTAGIMAQPKEGVVLPAVRACARAIWEAARLTPDGFANLRFAALGNVPAHAPFFPAAYHSGSRPAFALALECADEAYRIFRKAASLQEARQELIDTLEQHAQVLSSLAVELVQRYNIDFRGLDFSLAPYPAEWCSLGASIERLGLPALGGAGSLAAAAFVADTLDRGNWRRAGFNGLMLPVLEDSKLAQRAAEGVLTVKDLLMFSAVCGTGLDTIPLPGDTSEEQIAALLLDVAALSLRLNKPLTARLMPIPGKSAGDPTDFDFDFFAPSRVMALAAAPLQGMLAGDESFSLRPRMSG